VFPQDSPEYSIHGYFVSEGAKAGAASKQMHRILDRKYQLALKRFSRATDSDEIEQMWHEALEQGDIPGPYWAVMSHGETDEELRNRAFGEVHMLSHLTGAVNRADIKKLRQLEKNNEKLNDALDKSCRELKDKSQESLKLHKQIAEKDRRIQSLEDILNNAQQTIDSRPDLEELETKCSSLEKNLEKMNIYCKSLQERLEKEKEHTKSLVEGNHSLSTEIENLLEEQKALEKDLLALLSHQNLCDCPEKRLSENSLCGRAILYVGGHSNLVQHYRKLVESRGGTFLYHDGGQQDNPRRLPALLLQADAVCCPLDCISHDAVLRIKRVCKNSRTEHHLMRSAGLSSFAKFLGELMETKSLS
jgi:hypothetical protein